MKRAIILTCLSAAAVASIGGCGRTVVRETVVERPVVQRETIVQAPVVPMSCSIAGTTFSSGSMSCQAGYQYRCTDGQWERIPGSAC